jgi:hypothetical protein
VLVLGTDPISVWAVERIYCTGNAISAMAFFYRPGFAGYVDALAKPAGASAEETELGWSYNSPNADQSIERCKAHGASVASPLAPYSLGSDGEEFSCGLWARYGRLVVAFEIHWHDDHVEQEEVLGIFDRLEAKLSSPP